MSNEVAIQLVDLMTGVQGFYHSGRADLVGGF